MSGTASNPNESATSQRTIRWDAVAAIIATLVGLLALVVAGYTAYIQRQQVSAQVWPFLMLADSDNSSEYMWLNKGVGPALVKSVQVFVDGKPQHNWNATLRSMRLEKLDCGQSTLNRDVLSAGEKLDWLQFKRHQDFQTFRDTAFRARLGFKVCYCSTLGDCWMNDSTGASWNNRQAVGQCPKVPDSEQFDD